MSATRRGYPSGAAAFTADLLRPARRDPGPVAAGRTEPEPVRG